MSEKKILVRKYKYIVVIRTVLLMAVISLVLRLSVFAAGRSLLQQGIAEEVLRFHIVANSDSAEDQRIKYLVRNEVLEWMEEAMDQDIILEEAVDFMENHLDILEKKANQVLEREGAPYRAAAVVGNFWFSERSYEEYTFPAGYYRALRLMLGEADGHNWWCVLYPGQCFRDCLHAAAGEDQMTQLEEILTAEEYDALLQRPSGWKIAFRWF